MNKNDYLRRLKIGKTELLPNLQTLKLLQTRHLLNIPFENLDIHWKRPIILDTKKFYQKIVEEKRGGFCYELNGLFNELLKEIGFESKIISARVFNGANYGAEYDHLTILTKIDSQEYLVDVGFGSFIAEPLKLVLNDEQTDQNGIFVIKKYAEEYFEVIKMESGEQKSECLFKDSARDLQEFAEMCSFHQTSPESHFTRGKVCSVMTLNGRKTLTDDKFIETTDDKKVELIVDSGEEFNRILEREFHIRRNF